MTTESKKYAVLEAAGSAFVTGPDGTIMLYDSGKKAAEAAKRLAAETGLKYQPRPYVAPQVDWKARERDRFESGEYLPVLASLEQHCIEAHFVHVSKKNPAKLAYTRNEQDGAADVQKQISVRGYLEVYAPSVSEEVRIALAVEHEERFADCELKFARTPDAIEEVYTNYDSDMSGLSASCMRHDAYEFDSHIHPVRIYGAGDLAIAYLTNEEGETKARCLCWPDKKLYTRVYGSNCTSNSLHDLMRLHGYSKSCGYYGGIGPTLDGARLLRIKSGGSFVAPYCDDVPAMSEHSDSKYFVLDGDGDYSLHETNGLATGGCRCDCCEDHTNENDLNSVRTSDGTQSWCDDCCNDRAFYCNGRGEYLAESDYDSVRVDGKWYSQDYADYHFHFCDRCEGYSRSETHEVNTASGTREMCDECAKEHAFRCEVDGELYVNSLAAPGSIGPDLLDGEWQRGRYIGNLAADTPEAAPYHSFDPAQLTLPLAV
jgi:hypothetical protein